MRTAIDKKIDALTVQTAEQMRARGKTLEAQVRNVQHKMPKSVRGDVRFLLKNRQMLRHPQQRQQVDMAKVQAAYERVEAYLKTRDPKADRNKAILFRSAHIGFIVLFTLLAVITVMWLRGLI